MYMGLLSILLVVLVDIFSSALDVQLQSQATSSVSQDGRFLLSRFMYDLQRSENVVIPAAAGSQSNTLQITVGGINYTYAVESENLQISNNNGADTLNSFDTTVSNLSFQKIGNVGGKDTVKILFTLTGKDIKKSGREIKNFQTTVGLR